MSSLHAQLKGQRLTTAEIIYHLPDFPDILQSFVWQNLDTAPRFPILRRFLRFWDTNLEGALHHVRVASSPLVKPAESKFVEGELRLH